MATIGIDVGGTKILSAVVKHGEVKHLDKRPTPTTGTADLVDTLVAMVLDLHTDHDIDIERVGIGAPGVVSVHGGTLSNAPNLVGGAEATPLAALIEVGLSEAGLQNVEVKLGNDVDVAALGELRHGAGADQPDFLAVWWGTGVGGALVLDGELRTGPNGTAGEIGHTMYRAGGLTCRCGGIGHVEAYAGRASMEAEARRRDTNGEKSELVTLAGDDRMRSKIFATALDNSDPVAIDLIDTAVTALGVGIASAVTLLDVDLVVIGGGLGSRFGEPFADRIQTVARAHVFANPNMRVVVSQLGDDAGIVGAAELFN